MTIMLAPPGRTSVSALCLVQGLGANHCLISSGSVHALYTFSRGALMMRVSTSSRSAVMAALSAVVMLFSPFFPVVWCFLLSLLSMLPMHIGMGMERITV